MSATLFFLVLIGMLAVAWLLCFVGCWPNIQFGTPYSTLVIQANPVAYWPLNDMQGTPMQLQGSLQGSTSIGTANDASANGHNGTYILPPNYPTPAVGQSVPIPGLPALGLQQGSIVPGDVGSPELLLSKPASVNFEGGYVSIPWSTQNPQLPQFTLEAWIQPAWATTGILWVVFSAFVNNTGFRVLINDKNQLAVVIGNGTSGVEYALTSAINLTTMSYIAVTCDLSGNVTLFASGVSDTPVPVQTQTFPNTGYVPVVPTQGVTYFIGAGENDQPLRTPTTNPNGSPEFPFLGPIQSVALYNISNIDIQGHYKDGALLS